MTQPLKAGMRVRYTRYNGEVITGQVESTRQFGSAIYIRTDKGEKVAASHDRVEEIT